MNEQDHANARAKLMRAIVYALSNCTEADAARLVGDLSEFVRGIVREEMRAGSLKEVRLGKVGQDDLLGPFPESPCTCAIVPASNCPTHGVLKNGAHTKTAPHHHHPVYDHESPICTLNHEMRPNDCTDPHEEFHYPK